MEIADTAASARDAATPAGDPAGASGADAPDSRLFQLVRAAAHAADCQIAVFYQGAGPDFEAVASFGTVGAPGALRLGGAPNADEEALAAAAMASPAGEGGGGAFPPFVAAARVAHDGDDGATRGVLVVADNRAARATAGLSAAQFYVLRAHAAQLAALLELHEVRRVASAALAGAERLRLLESVAVHANDAILITEAEPIGLPGPRILYCNAAFTRTTGYAESEIVGRTPRLLQGPGTDRAALAKLRGALSRWEPVVVELLIYRKDGTTFWVELSIVPVADETGWFTHWVSVQRDVSGRKEAEETATRARIAEAEREALEAEVKERRRVEERQTLLARELDHRAKNALAVVQAALRLTPREDAEAFARAVEGRVSALARAHTLLSQGRWDGAELGALAKGELAPFLAGGAGDGPRGAARAARVARAGRRAGAVHGAARTGHQRRQARGALGPERARFAVLVGRRRRGGWAAAALLEGSRRAAGGRAPHAPRLRLARARGHAAGPARRHGDARVGGLGAGLRGGAAAAAGAGRGRHVGGPAVTAAPPPAR